MPVARRALMRRSRLESSGRPALPACPVPHPTPTLSDREHVRLPSGVDLAGKTMTWEPSLSMPLLIWPDGVDSQDPRRRRGD